MTKTALEKRDWIADLEKGLAILEIFDDQHARMTPTQAATRRYLLTLRISATCRRTANSSISRRACCAWAGRTSNVLAAAHRVQPYLQQLSAQIHESVYVSVLDYWNFVIIARNGSTHVMTTGFVLGAHVPAARYRAASSCSLTGPTKPPCVAGSMPRIQALHAADHHEQGTLYEKIRQARVDGWLCRDGAAVADGRAGHRRADQEPAWRSGGGVVGEHADRKENEPGGAGSLAEAASGNGFVDAEHHLTSKPQSNISGCMATRSFQMVWKCSQPISRCPRARGCISRVPRSRASARCRSLRSSTVVGSSAPAR